MSSIINFLAGTLLGKIYLALVIIAAFAQMAFIINVLFDRFSQINRNKTRAKESLEEAELEETTPFRKAAIKRSPKPIETEPLELSAMEPEEYSLVDYLHDIDDESEDNLAAKEPEEEEIDGAFGLTDHSNRSDGDYPPPPSNSHNVVIDKINKIDVNGDVNDDYDDVNDDDDDEHIS